MTKRIYLASSWRNPFQQDTVGILRAAGHEVYDFQHPPGGDQPGFSWSEVDPDWHGWTADQYVQALQHPVAQAGFRSDYDAMRWADTFVLLLPCGKSAHLEAGWAVGAGKPLHVLLDPDAFGPHAVDPTANADLMYLLATAVHTNASQLVLALEAS